MRRTCPRCDADTPSFRARSRASVARPMSCGRCQAPLAPIGWPSSVLIALGILGVPAAAFFSLAVESWWPLILSLFLFLFGPSFINGVVPLRVVRRSHTLVARILGWTVLVPALVYGFACLALVAYGLLKGAL
jgi:hypothetical protein